MWVSNGRHLSRQCSPALVFVPLQPMSSVFKYSCPPSSTLRAQGLLVSQDRSLQSSQIPSYLLCMLGCRYADCPSVKTKMPSNIKEQATSRPVNVCRRLGVPLLAHVLGFGVSVPSCCSCLFSCACDWVVIGQSGLFYEDKG